MQYIDPLLYPSAYQPHHYPSRSINQSPQLPILSGTSSPNFNPSLQDLNMNNNWAGRQYNKSTLEKNQAHFIERLISGSHVNIRQDEMRLDERINSLSTKVMRNVKTISVDNKHSEMIKKP